MIGLRLAMFVAIAALCGACGIGAPERASDIQNLHGISDDISAVTMTQSDALHAHDPNIATTLPTHYQVVKEDASATIPLP